MRKEGAVGKQDSAQLFGYLQGGHRVKFRGGGAGTGFRLGSGAVPTAIVLGVETGAGKKKDPALSGFAPLRGKNGIASVRMIWSVRNP